MNFVNLQKRDGMATLTLSRGKVNALNNDVVDYLKGQLHAYQKIAHCFHPCRYSKSGLSTHRVNPSIPF
jgi:hypothetical protein